MVSSPSNVCTFTSAAQESLDVADLHLAQEINTVAFETLVRFHAKLNVKIARRTIAMTAFALVAHAKLRARINAGWNRHANFAADFRAAFASASGAWIANNFACALAGRAGLRNRKETLR